MKTLGQRIYFARVSTGRRTMSDFGRDIAQAEGRATPYHVTTVSDWEHDKAIPTLAAVDAIAKATGVELEWLVRGTGDVRAAQQQARVVA